MGRDAVPGQPARELRITPKYRERILGAYANGRMADGNGEEVGDWRRGGNGGAIGPHLVCPRTERRDGINPDGCPVRAKKAGGLSNMDRVGK